jgi:hypothetical protein
MRIFTLGVAALLCLPFTAFSADQMRPGLWEMHMQSDAMRGMPSIPPEQMEQMRRMGIPVPKMQNDGIVTEVCIMKEMAQSQSVPHMSEQTGCEIENQKRSGNQYSADIVCDGSQMKGKGRVKGSMKSAGQVESTYEFEGTVEGRPVKHQQVSSGRWIAADCGKVKPMTEMGR